MSGTDPRTPRKLTDAQRLAARVLDCLAAVTPGVLDGTRPHGARIGVPAALLRELAAEVDRQYPGALKETQERTAAAQRAKAETS